ncbi:MAG: hypothetical protein VKJ64_01260 [Leptolyngbyaceae bacterium]|nr:hypothetical protein [Leptolyngbyaceae bacterium]
MDWIHANRVTYNIGVVFLTAIAIAGSVYLGGYPWNCEQAIQVRSMARMLLRRSQNEYPPGTPYRQYREEGQRHADVLVKAKCKSVGSTADAKPQALKFFLKYRSDYEY